MTTMDWLQDRLQRELAWRKKEISDLRSLAAHSIESDFHVFRSGQVMLCAHWEGFLKKAAELYMRYVFSQGVRLRSLAPNIVAAALYGDVMKASQAEYPGSEDHHVRLVKSILANIDRSDARCTWDVQTEGNPGSAVLERILLSVGIDRCLEMDAAKWSTTQFFINEQLVRDRHKIAHGEGLRIDQESFLDRTKRLLELLDTVAFNFIKCAENKCYLSAEVEN